MKKYILGLVLGALLVPAVVPAVTIDELQAQIRSLLEQITQLTRQINDISQTPNTPVTTPPEYGQSRVCDFFSENRPWVSGASGEHVAALQEFLREEGYLDVSPTGYFGSLTAAAVKKLQAKEGIDAVGVVGPATQGYFKRWCNSSLTASPRSGSAPLTVTLKAHQQLANNTMVADAGDYKIVFGDGTEHVLVCSGASPWCKGPHTVTHTYPTNGTYTATLVHFGFYGPEGSPPERIVGSVTISVGSFAGCTKEYRPVCGQPSGCKPCNAPPGVACAAVCNLPDPVTYGNKCSMEAQGATLLHEGQCRTDAKPFEPGPNCKAWYDGCNNCFRQTPGDTGACTERACVWQAPGYCTEYFGNVRENQAPVISGFSGPSLLKVNETGTWTVEASDPEQKQLSYKVTWGDDVRFWDIFDAAASALGFEQRTTFTHAYSKSGTYTVTIVVRDNEGKEAKTTATVQVSNETPVACTLEYAPVCATPSYCLISKFAPGAYPKECEYGKTYGNTCAMNAENAVFKHEGECQQYAVCTQDAKQCPDGTWVGRVGPNCEFAACPSTTTGTPGSNCTFTNTAVGGFCGGYYHCAAGVNYHYWSATLPTSCVAAR